MRLRVRRLDRGIVSFRERVPRVFMLVAPQVWYDFVPGVTDTGFFNQHFIRDIGIIQLFLGVAFIVGLLRPERRIGLWAAATLWLVRARPVPPVGGRRRHLLALGHTARFSRRHPAALIGIALTLWAIRRSRAGRAAFA